MRFLLAAILITLGFQLLADHISKKELKQVAVSNADDYPVSNGTGVPNTL
jgi:hypothetical protein